MWFGNGTASGAPLPCGRGSIVRHRIARVSKRSSDFSPASYTRNHGAEFPPPGGKAQDHNPSTPRSPNTGSRSFGS